jgi:hypothetical protein
VGEPDIMPVRIYIYDGTAFAGEACTTRAMRIGPQMLLKVLLDMHEAAPDNHGESWRAPFAHAFRSTTDFSSMRRIGALSQSCLVKVAGKPI